MLFLCRPCRLSLAEDCHLPLGLGLCGAEAAGQLLEAGNAHIQGLPCRLSPADISPSLAPETIPSQSTCMVQAGVTLCDIVEWCGDYWQKFWSLQSALPWPEVPQHATVSGCRHLLQIIDVWYTTVSGCRHQKGNHCPARQGRRLLGGTLWRQIRGAGAALWALQVEQAAACRHLMNAKLSSGSPSWVLKAALLRHRHHTAGLSSQEIFI